MKFDLLKKGWSLLVKREKQSALWVLCIVLLSALSSVVMVGSVMPFLATLTNPEHIRENSILKWAYEVGGFRSDYEFLVVLGAVSVMVIVLTNVIQILRVYLVSSFTMMRMHTISERLLSVYMRQPYEFFLGKNSGELGSQILNEAQQICRLFYQPAADVITSFLTLSAIITLLIWVNPLVAITSMIIAGGCYFVIFFITRKLIDRLGARRSVANKLRFRIANESLAGVKEIKLLMREANYAKMYSSPSRTMARTESIVDLLLASPGYVIQIVAFGGIIILTLLLIDPAVMSKDDSVGEILPLLGVFAFGGQRLVPELAKLYQGVSQLRYGAPLVHSIYADLQAEHQLPQLNDDEAPPLGLKHSLELRDVSYCYPDCSGAGINGVSLKINAGERIGIVGGSGAGKTTLADVMMGLLRCTQGKIIVDGNKIGEDNIRLWQRSVGYVQQGIFLSDASLLQNIALGLRPSEIDPERVFEASRMAQLDTFVRNDLPYGYDTIVGDRGLRLSGGQKQRIGIARALYNDADLIVFDEATSALDNVTEKDVLQSIQTLPGEKTVIFIAHRLTTLQNCDRLIVMEHGRVVGVGTWDELCLGNKQFRELLSTCQVNSVI